MILWQINVGGNSETYLGLHVKFVILLLYFNQIWNLSVGVHRISQYQTSQKSVLWGAALIHAEG